jgi:hypothetical protein
MNGKTLTNVKLITNVGVYNIASNLALTPYYEGEATAKTVSTKTIEVSGLPDNISNTKVSVYYTTGSGRQIETHYLVKDAIIDNGIVTLETEMEEEQTYTVYITSGNYAQITLDVALNIPTPLPPYYDDDNDNNSNDEDSSTSSETAPTTTIEPSYTTSSGIVVTGWKNVIEGVVKDSDLYQYGSVGDVSAVTSRKTLNINLKNTTNLVIPTEVVSTMKQSGADYNFYYKNTAITISQEKLVNHAGSIDLNFEMEYKKFNDDFDSFSLKMNKDTSLVGTVINPVLSTDKAGKGAYIFKKSGNNVYEPAGAAFISEIGTVTLSIDDTDDILILY